MKNPGEESKTEGGNASGDTGTAAQKENSDTTEDSNSEESGKEEAKTENTKKVDALDKLTDKLTGKDAEGESNGTGVTDMVDSGTSGASDGSGSTTSSSQMVGALAVTYADSSNHAYIATTGSVTAADTLGIHADGAMTGSTFFDS